MNEAQKRRKRQQRRAAQSKAVVESKRSESESAEPARPSERPRIIGLLSFYDENPAWLAASIASLAKIDVDHLVALDGAYRLYPGGKNQSPPEQHEAITETALGLGIGLTLHVPPTTWAGNEVEKRSAMFAFAEQTAVPNHDWYLVIDADELLKSVPADTRDRLAATERDAAAVTFHNRSAPTTDLERRFNWDPISRVTIPIFFRAVPDLRLRGNHYTYVAGDGRVLWGLGDAASSGIVEDFYDLTDLTIDHRTAFRGKHRSAQQRRYYEIREVSKIETPSCCRCDNEPTKLVHCQFELNESGLIGRSLHVCDEHADELEEEALRQLRKLGVDPREIDWDAFTPAR